MNVFDHEFHAASARVDIKMFAISSNWVYLVVLRAWIEPVQELTRERNSST